MKAAAESGSRLPIYEIEETLLAALRAHRRAVVQAPTGSGKSTQIPQMLARSDLASGQIVVLQPRRLAARMLAARVAREMGTRLGEGVGYQVRFEDRSRSDTRIKYVTEGILLRQALTDPGLTKIGAICFDEFHERHLYGDVTLAWATQVQRTARPDLLLLALSATLDPAPVAAYLRPCGVATGAGRAWPVSVEYLDREPDPRKTPVWDLAARELERVLPEHPEGDVLVFMPGAYEIGRTLQALAARPAFRSFERLPLHGDLPPETQDAVVARSDKRKIIVSTNVAETSLTIEGVRVVVDSGLARVARFDAARGINALWIEKISRASADQRSGRAGRTAPGHCVRLWTETDHGMRPEAETPEIHRVDLAEVALTLKAAGVRDLASFPWFEPPEAWRRERAEALLRDLGATDARTGEITETGRRMTAFPVHPRHARMLLAAGERGCVRPVALVAALTQERNILLPRQGRDIEEQRERKIEDSAESDFVGLVNAWQYAARHDYSLDACRQVGVHAAAARQAGRLFEQFVGLAKQQGLEAGGDSAEVPALAKCLLAGFSDHVACRVREGGTRCEMAGGRRGDVSRDSAVRKSRLLVACEVREIEARKGEKDVRLNLATAIRPEWLEEMFPGDFRTERSVRFDPETRRVVLEQKRMFRDLAIETKRGGDPTPDEAAEVLVGEIEAGRLRLPGWDEAVEAWIARVDCTAAWRPESGVAAFGPEDRRRILRELCRGSFGYKDLKERPVLPVVKKRLTRQQIEAVERYAPERLTLPNGRTAKVSYAAGKPPSISAPIQSLYGVEGPLTVAGGRVAVLVNVLAPNQRPVQVTQDMANFWREHYPRVKSELRRRYPKHEWR